MSNVENSFFLPSEYDVWFFLRQGRLRIISNNGNCTKSTKSIRQIELHASKYVIAPLNRTIDIFLKLLILNGYNFTNFDRISIILIKR